jgi:hypothetical protein
VARRRAKCLEAALMRFVTRDPTMALPQRRGVKRKATHGAVVREALLETTGSRSTYLYAAAGVR